MSPYSIEFMISRGALPQERVPTQQELVRSILKLLRAIPLQSIHQAPVREAVIEANRLMRRVPGV